MTFGEKIIALKDSGGFKNFQEFGSAIGFTGKEPGSWLLDLSKRDSIQNVDITRLKQITDYFDITIDELLEDTDMQGVDLKNDLLNTDIAMLLENINLQLKDSKSTFNGYKLNKKTKKIISDSIFILNQMINDSIKGVDNK